jgi:hypothetical protein
MRLTVRFADGSLRPAIMLITIGDRIRASVPGCCDAVEFRFEDGHWFDEAENLVDIDFDVPDQEFASLVQDSAAACDDRSDALEVHLWSLCLPMRSSASRVN